ncbi:MAG: hypothetical protein KC619_28435 [Myxococcales bacterium]|nr:hypothetical protein [Myxococcales bacterium]
MIDPFAMARARLLALSVLLAACGQSHPTIDAGGRSDAGPPPCDAPSATVLVQSDLTPGTEAVSIVVELNDVIVTGTGVMASDDLAGGVALGPLCGLVPGSRIVVRILDARGAEVANRLLTVDAVEDGSTLTFVLSRGG